MFKLRELFHRIGLLQFFVLSIIIIVLFYNKNDSFLIVTYIYLLFLAFSVIKNKNTSLLANNTSILLLLFIFLYGLFNSLIEIIIDKSISEGTYFATLAYGLAINGLTVGIITKRIKNEYRKSYLNNLNCDKQSNIYVTFLISVLIVLILYKTIFFYKLGILFSFNNNGVENRLEMFDSLSQVDVVVGLLIIGIFNYFVYYHKKISKLIVVTTSLLLIYYIIMQLSVGNRRDFVPIILGVFWVFVNLKNINFGLSSFIIVITIIFGFNYLGTLRANTGVKISFNENVTNTLLNNEFVYPFFTTKYEIEEYRRNVYIYNFNYGGTYIVNSITIFIPRSIFPSKPESLANQTLKKMFGNNTTIGLAYSPVTEAFINFGFIGCYGVFVLIGRFLIKLQNNKNQILNFIFFTLVIDFCRGEMATFLYTFIFISLFFLLHRLRLK
ncbi:hypothetical protein MOXK23_08410 [Moraxella sp. K23]